MNDGNAMLHRHLLQGIGDGRTNEIGMLGGAANDDAEGDHGIRCAATQHQLGANGNLKRARDAIDIDGGVRSDDLDLLLGGIEQALDELLLYNEATTAMLIGSWVGRGRLEA
jgi:hypothetical protein